MCKETCMPSEADGQYVISPLTITAQEAGEEVDLTGIRRSLGNEFRATPNFT